MILQKSSATTHAAAAPVSARPMVQGESPASRSCCFWRLESSTALLSLHFFSSIVLLEMSSVPPETRSGPGLTITGLFPSSR